MTLLVAVQCVDGVVLAADSAATLGALGQQTVRQATVKVDIVKSNTLIAVSGHVGLGQRIIAAITAELAKMPGDPVRAGSQIRQALWKELEPEFKAAQGAAPAIGQHAALESVLTATVLATPIGGRPCLIQFNQQGSPEVATPGLPFVCVGSGMTLADPFMAFLRGLFWQPMTLPTLVEGTFAAVWTLRQAIDVAPGGLGDPIRAYQLTGTGGKCAARALDQPEIDEHFQAIDDARAALRDFRKMDAVTPPLPSPADPTLV